MQHYDKVKSRLLNILRQLNKNSTISEMGRHGTQLKNLGVAGQIFSTGKSLKTMTDVFTPIEAFMMDQLSFDMWRVKLEAKMVQRIKRAG